MTLSDFLSKAKIDRNEFARQVGVDAVTVWRWEKGKRYPPFTSITKIMEVTDGKVTANDFVKGYSP